MRRETHGVLILGTKITNVQVRIFFHTIFDRRPSPSMAFSLHWLSHAETHDGLYEQAPRDHQA